MSESTLSQSALSQSTLQTNEPRDASATEATHTGRVLAPAVDIFENARTITLLADMPGVAPDQLEIDLNEGVLTITGRVSPPREVQEDVVLREYGPAMFQRKFTLSQSVDQAKIEARLEDGVLRLELPKIEKAQPRKIQVNQGKKAN
jgi:HSP20 family molecular chaperone IbpA